MNISMLQWILNNVINLLLQNPLSGKVDAT